MYMLALCLHISIRSLNVSCPNMEQLIDFNVLIGKYIVGMDLEEIFPIWAISCTYITKMYHDTLNNKG